MAESSGDPQRTPEEVIVNVLEDGRLVVAGDTLTRDELVGLLKRTAQHDPTTPVTIRGHRSARHEMIVSVMDACGLAGLSNLAVGTSTDDIVGSRG